MRELAFERTVKVIDGALVATSVAHNDEGHFVIKRRLKPDVAGFPFWEVELLLSRVRDQEEFYCSGGGEPLHFNPAITRRSFKNRADMESTFAFARSEGLTLQEIADRYGYSSGYVRIVLKRREREIQRMVLADLDQ